MARIHGVAAIFGVFFRFRFSFAREQRVHLAFPEGDQDAQDNSSLGLRRA